METKPLQILFRGDAMETIERLQEKTGTSSKADVIRDAVYLYSVLDSIANGSDRLIVRSENSKIQKLITIPRKRPEVHKM
ncbi:MAG: hypothetical protein AABX33_06470 [Nanoarchaeota archaeon]